MGQNPHRKWMMSRNNHVRGPFSDEEIVQLIRTGKLSSQDFIADAHDEKNLSWQMTSHVPDFQSFFAKPKPKKPSAHVGPKTEAHEDPIEHLVAQAHHLSADSEKLLATLKEQETDFESYLFETAHQVDENVRHHATSETPLTKLDESQHVLSEPNGPSFDGHFLKVGAGIAVVIVGGIWLNSTLKKSSKVLNETTNEMSQTQEIRQPAATTGKSELVRPAQPSYQKVAPSTTRTRFPSHMRAPSATRKPAYIPPAEEPMTPPPSEGDADFANGQNLLKSPPSKGYLRRRFRDPTNLNKDWENGEEVPTADDESVPYDDGSDSYSNEE